MSGFTIGDRVVWKRTEAGAKKPEFYDAAIVKIDLPVVQIKAALPNGEAIRTVHVRNLTKQVNWWDK